MIRTFSPFLAMWLSLCAGFLYAQTPSIRLEVFSQGTLRPQLAQDWGAAMQTLGFQSVRFRTGDESDALDIVDLGDENYKVSALLTDNNEIYLPGRVSFSRNRIREIYPYLEKQIALMKLSAAPLPAANAQMQEVAFRDLAQPVGFSTQERKRRLVLKKIIGDMENVRVRTPAAIASALSEEDLVPEELQDVSRGTSLAYLLRYIGYCAVPRRQADGAIVLTLVDSRDVGDETILPIGYPVERPGEIDILFEKFNANVNGVRAQVVLDSLQSRLQIPFLYDYNSILLDDIDLEEVVIKQKPARFTYSRLLDLVLYQAGLQKEVRMDEAGNVFLWITTIRPAGG
ncbi:MAG: hypothetical protein Q4D38_01995 [Planctomycetia bacterium]|nr:hypothetical protein [Planctomycetia bacterium]